MWDLSPWPGIEPEPLTPGTPSVNHWGQRGRPWSCFSESSRLKSRCSGVDQGVQVPSFPQHMGICNRGGRGRTLQKGVLGRLAGGVSVGAPHLQAHKLSAYDTQPPVGSACLGRRLQEAGGLVSSRQARELMRTLVTYALKKKFRGSGGEENGWTLSCPPPGPLPALSSFIHGEAEPGSQSHASFYEKVYSQSFQVLSVFFFFLRKKKERNNPENPHPSLSSLF